MNCPVPQPGATPAASATAASSSLAGMPSVVINEPPDEALIKWLKDCRLDQASIEKVGACLKFDQMFTCI